MTAFRPPSSGASGASGEPSRYRPPSSGASPRYRPPHTPGAAGGPFRARGGPAQQAEQRRVLEQLADSLWTERNVVEYLLFKLVTAKLVLSAPRGTSPPGRRARRLRHAPR